MKHFILTSGLASFMALAVHGQQTAVSTTPSVSVQPQTSQQTTVQPNAGTSQSQGTVQTTTGAGGQLPQTGQASGTTTNQFNMNQTTQLKIQAVTASDQPIATQIQQVLTTEPVLTQTLPMVNIQVNGGVVLLNGDVQCGAESVLMQNLIQQRLPNVIRIDNRLRLPGGAFAPAVRVPR